MAIPEKILEKLKKYNGIVYPPFVYKIERGMIERFIEAVEGSSRQRDNEDSLIAPPTFPIILGFDRMIQELNMDSSLTILHGSTNLECYHPISSDDTITAEATISNIREREGEKGTTLFVTFEIKCHNQRNEHVATCKQLAIIY